MPARARHTDPETSHAAAASITEEQLSAGQQAILRILGIVEVTDEELVRIYSGMRRLHEPAQISASGIRTRRRELADKGLVSDTGRRARTMSGRQAIVWGVPR